MSGRLSSYSKILALGHKAISDILDGDVIVEEKIDGSQFSIGVVDGELHCRSKGCQIHVDAPDNMFARGVETALRIKDKLTPGWTYRGEYLKTAKHNTLAYGRAPNDSFIVFDVETSPSHFLPRREKEAEALRLGLEVVPCFYEGSGADIGLERLKAFLENDSVLGAQKVEGVVIKNYSKFTLDGKLACAKIVSEQFKEIHGAEWKKNNPNKSDVVEMLVAKYGTEPRRRKAVQRLRESGQLTETPKDIGLLLKSVGQDIREECAADIAQELFDHFWGDIARGISKSIPLWYKAELGLQS
jgi:hypothetical protein